MSYQVPPFTNLLWTFIRVRLYDLWDKNPDWHIARYVQGSYYIPGYNNSTDYMLIHNADLVRLDSDEGIVPRYALGPHLKPDGSVRGGYYVIVVRPEQDDAPLSIGEDFNDLIRARVVSSGYWLYPNNSLIITHRMSMTPLADGLYSMVSWPGAIPNGFGITTKESFMKYSASGIGRIS